MEWIWKWKLTIIWGSLWISAFFVWWHYNYLPFFIGMASVMLLGFVICIGTAYYPKDEERVVVPFEDAVQVCFSIYTPMMLLLTVTVVWIELMSFSALNYSIPAEDLTQTELWFRLMDLEEKKEQQEVEEEPVLTRLEQVKELEKELELD